VYGPAEYETVARQLLPTPQQIGEARRWILTRLAETQVVTPADARAFARARFGGDENVVHNARDAREQAQIISYWSWALAAREAMYDLARAGVAVPVAMPPMRDAPPAVDTDGPQVPLSDSAPFGRPFSFPTVPLFPGYRFASALDAERTSAIERFVEGGAHTEAVVTY
jgi:hypothetical protein